MSERSKLFKNEFPITPRSKIPRKVLAACIAIGIGTGSSLSYATSVAANGYIGIAEKADGPLPAAVAARVPHIVKLDVAVPVAYHESPTGADTVTYERGAISGTSLGDGYFLSAGHSIIEDQMTLPIDDAVACSKVNIQGTYDDRAYQVEALGNVAYNSGYTDDMAVHKITKEEEYKVTGQQGDDLPPGPEFSDEPLQEGDVVYFMNWQPTADGQARRPGGADGLDTPAIFPGVVIEDGVLPQAVTAISSLGQGSPDAVGRRGQSGGAVLNAQGELVGLSNGVAQKSWAERLLSMHIGSFGLPGNGEYITMITPVTEAGIDELKSQAADAPIC